MKKLLILFSLILAFISCDGREKAYRKNQTVLKEANLLDSFTEQIKFFPETYTEIVTDTILSGGLQIKINYHSLENDFVLKITKTKEDTVVKEHFKNFEAQINFFKNNRLIIKNVINKDMFSEFENSDFWKDAIMQHVWVDYLTSNDKQICLNTTFNIPNTTIYKDYIILLNEDGTFKIKELKTNITTI